MRVRAGTVFASSFAFAGCALLFDADDLVVGGAGASVDGGADARLDDAGGDAPGPTCELALPPARPSGTTAPGGEELVLAFDTFKASTSATEGFDLDGRCTCTPGVGAAGAPSCTPPQGGQTACDDDAGRDNAVATFVGSLGLGGKPLDVGYEDSVHEGRAATLLQITEYSGAPNDEAVEVAVYDSPGTEPQVPCPSGSVIDAGLNDAGRPLPGLGGCDVWARATSSVVGGGFPKVRTNNAWVRDGVLVARFEVVLLSAGAVALALYEAVLSGRLVPGTPRRLEGLRLGGRITARDVLRVFGERRSRPESPPLCFDAVTYAVARAKVCAGLDLSTRPSPDGTIVCDSMSFVFEGSAVAARLGGLEPPSPPPSACADAGDFASCP